MKRPVIGVVPLFDSEKNSYRMIPGYMRGLEAACALSGLFSGTPSFPIFQMMT